MANQPGIVLYRLEYASIRGKLSLEQKGELLDALMDFSETGEEYQGGDPYVSMAFSFFSAAIQRSAEEYERKCQKNRENVGKRWHKDDGQDTDEYDRIPDDTDEYDREQTKRIQTEQIESKRKTKRTRTVFVPPSIDEVAAYCRERGNGIDADRFVTYYQARGWEMSNGRRMKDWKAAVRTWESNGKEARSGELRGGRAGDHVPGQRDLYTL